MKRFALFVLVVLTACAPSTQAIQTAIAQTQAAVPTVTPIPPSATATATTTPKPFVTMTLKPSFTPPPTNTRISQDPTEYARTATAQARAANALSTLQSARATKDAAIALATNKATYTAIAVRELVTYPDKHKGEKVMVKGRIFNINNDQEFQIWVGGNYDAVYVYMTDPYSNLYEDDSVTIYGIVQGSNCGTNSYGAKICQPLIFGDFYTKQ